MACVSLSRHEASKRQRGLDAFASGQHIMRHIETDGVAREIGYRESRRVDRRLVQPRSVEPGAMCAGDPTVETGDERNT